jgi:L-fuculose-phosphate aldolase
MANHGAIAYGPDLETAMDQARLLEWACEVYWRARAIGTPRTLDQSQQLAFVETVSRRGYGITRRSEP